MKMKDLIRSCAPGNSSRVKEFERYTPEHLVLRKKEYKFRKNRNIGKYGDVDQVDNKFMNGNHPQLIHKHAKHLSKVPNSHGDLSTSYSSASSSTSSVGKSTFYDLDEEESNFIVGTRTLTISNGGIKREDESSPVPSTSSSGSSLTGQNEAHSIMENMKNYDLSSLEQNLEPQLKIGDRVVWLREPLNEAGVVKWLGKIEGEEIAGIEFDKALNLGSGYYQNRRYFQCKPEHGGFIAVAGLILEQDLNFSSVDSQVISPSSNYGDSVSNYHPPTRIGTSNRHHQQNQFKPSQLLSLITGSGLYYKKKPIMPSLPSVHPPLRAEDADAMEGRNKGIQGHRNSCYLDSTLFAMYSFSSVFDSILIAPFEGRTGSDEEILAREVQYLLREKIVNPLREHMFTPACNVMNLREKMHHLDVKLTSEEMDPQEFLELLFNHVLKLDKFLHLSSGESDYFHQVLCKPDEDKIPTVQGLVEQSFREQKLKFTKVPLPVLLLQMPRSGNKYKMFRGVLPNLTIDITDLIQNIPRTCIICGNVATDECPDCYGLFTTNENREDLNAGIRTPLGSGAFSTAFCSDCIQRVHHRVDRKHHQPNIVPISYNYDIGQIFPRTTSNASHSMTNGNSSLSNSTSNYYPASTFFSPNASSPSDRGDRNCYGLPTLPSSFFVTNSKSIPRVTMDLFAVICIETSHFVSFVRCGVERDAPWVFFDSMADRTESYDGKGGENIPHVRLIPQMGKWLEQLETGPTVQASVLDTANPDLKRMMSDPYICLYYSPQASMYS